MLILYKLTRFIDELSELLVPVLAKSKNILVMGDFNIHANNIDDADNILLQNWLTASGLVNHVSFPTHGITFNLVATKYAQHLEILSAEPGESLSGHTEVIIHVDVDILCERKLLSGH